MGETLVLPDNHLSAIVRLQEARRAFYMPIRSSTVNANYREAK
jgi:hypothetical protein